MYCDKNMQNYILRKHNRRVLAIYSYDLQVLHLCKCIIFKKVKKLNAMLK